ncbi:MAG: TadE/TadG family type IV pilus assembly protein [Geminicoccaceae bacterium]
MQIRALGRQWSHRIAHRLLSVAGLRACHAATLNPVLEPMAPPPRSPVSSDAGAAAVELAFVLPFAMLLLMGIIQFGALLFLQNTMVNVANDVARRVSVGDLTATAGETLAEERLSGWNATFTVSVTEPTTDDIQVDISVPLADAAIVDFGHLLDTGDLTAQATVRKE